MAASVIKHETKVRVSSVLNRDVKQFGKKYLTDHNDDTCWNSDQGSPQWILLDFGCEVKAREIHIQFQGGFAGKDCWIETGSAIDQLSKSTDIYPEDINSLQIFPLSDSVNTFVLKIVFNTSTDFYGRITVYKLDVLGDPS